MYKCQLCGKQVKGKAHRIVLEKRRKVYEVPTKKDPDKTAEGWEISKEASVCARCLSNRPKVIWVRNNK